MRTGRGPPPRWLARPDGHIDVRLLSAANDVTAIGGFNTETFGQTITAYQDVLTTNDPGARLVQFVLRINF